MRLNRPAFTLVELLVATALTGIVTAAIARTLMQQQRFFLSATSIMTDRSQLRDGADILAAEIRGAATSTLGVPLMTDSAIELFTSIGASVACSGSTGAAIGLAPSLLANGAGLTSILAQPDTGDLALILAVGAGATDSARWVSHRILSFSASALANSCPQSTGFTTTADNAAGTPGYMLTLSAPPAVAVTTGAPIRFVRRARYSLYRSSDGEWYLGYRRCNATGVTICQTIQPVSGPYLRYASRATDVGLTFRYFGRDGMQLASGAESSSLARVEIVVRGETRVASSLAGERRTKRRDSVLVTISPRNRRR